MAAAQARMQKGVAEAAVVVVNPVHFAVALRYRAGSDAAPVVVEKGRLDMAQALIAAARNEDYPAKIALVIASQRDAGGLEIAAASGIEALALDHRPYGKDREAHERVIDAALRDREIEIVALAGYMRVLTPFLVRSWSGRMINIHPSLLPKYPGLHTHERAIAAGDAEAGCTVHLVTEGVDEGPILGQARVPILPGDTADALAARVLAEEHRLYPKCLADLARTLVP
jgi:formyltetrahydrofolate-dependent phosphoribosylglycinamide formyltransferase